MMERYRKLATPPADALSQIEAGRLKGFTDINAQWRIEAMTDEFGECGVGWRYEIADKMVHTLADGQIILYMQVALYVLIDGEWSHPIYGMGGDFIVKMENKGLRANDEAYKMCLTDALGNAMRCLGVAADVYRKKSDTKYGKSSYEPKQQEQQAWKKEGGKVLILSGNGEYCELSRFSMKSLQKIVSDDKYKAIKWDIAKAIKEKQANE